MLDEIFSVSFVLNVGAQEILGALLTVAFGYTIIFIRSLRWKGWTLQILDLQGNEATFWEIGPKKAEEILEDPGTMSQYLKGLSSPYGWIVFDVVQHGPRMGGLQIDKKKKRITVNLSAPDFAIPVKGRG